MIGIINRTKICTHVEQIDASVALYTMIEKTLRYYEDNSSTLRSSEVLITQLKVFTEGN